MVRFSYCGLIGVLVVVLILPVPSWAQLTVIYDTGHTESITPYLKTLQAADSQHLTTAAGNPTPDSDLMGAAQLSNLLPIRSPGLTPGEISSHTVSETIQKRLAMGNAPPFFIIGSDDMSLRWLQSHRAALQRMGAVGMLVQAETEAEVRRVAGLAQGLPITLGSASDIAQALGIRRYPVLISANGVEQ
jgi:integrating conjugative element protein (TIGR03765 family)